MSSNLQRITCYWVRLSPSGFQFVPTDLIPVPPQHPDFLEEVVLRLGKCYSLEAVSSIRRVLADFPANPAVPLLNAEPLRLYNEPEVVYERA